MSNKKRTIQDSYLIMRRLSFLLCAATLFMGIGYASINSISMNIKGTATALAQESGLFISTHNITYDSDNSNDDEAIANISQVNQTIMTSTLELSKTNKDSYITYEITIRNDTPYNYTYDSVIYTLDANFYDNENIVFDELNGLTKGDMLYSKDAVTFTMKFHYKDYILAENNKLNSILKFNFIRSYIGDTIPNMMRDLAVVDNKSSEFVTSATGISFLNSSSAENGRGIYLFSPTANDTNPIYYYRGNIDNNNIILGKYCWKIVRTTDSGGVKLLFNGLKAEDSSCNNEGAATVMASGKTYNSTGIGIAGAGYNYTEKTRLKLSARNDSSMVVGTIFASDIAYNAETGKYTLAGEKVLTTSDFSNEKVELLKNHHYTCLKTVEEECTSVYYFYMERNLQTFYATLNNGLKNISELLKIEFDGNSTNENRSSIHTTVNDWYAAEMINYGSYIEDTIYCNDRSLYNPWSQTSPVINDNNLKMHFDTKARVAYTGKPSLDCKYKADSFTVSSTLGNGKLTYPTGLLTYDEAALAGMAFNISSDDSYLNNGRVWWTMSPGFVSATGVYNGVIHTMLDHVATNYTSGNAGGVRPVISLKPGIILKDGKGTPISPFIIE